ncbi:hypothetical protein Hamer_G019750 [Homarus americanus]|uniref:Integrase p58-like C-terminal domain-containing protein n=1 Tax=Homarus americanus TaxID=6706 RepID=A0A8J5KE42_HOMAM|nr:hypothetical protein Hamer_G019750 [Homarus americanus]
MRQSTGYTTTKLMLGHELWLPVALLTERPPDEELPEETISYFSGEVMKLNHDVKASQVWLYIPLWKKGQSPKLQSPWEGPYTVMERLSDVTYRIRERRKTQPKVVYVNRLWQYHGPGQYTWEVSEEQSPTTDKDLTRYPGRTQGRTDLGNPTRVQEEEHRSRLAELDVTGEGPSENATEVAVPREDSEVIPSPWKKPKHPMFITPSKYQRIVFSSHEEEVSGLMYQNPKQSLTCILDYEECKKLPNKGQRWKQKALHFFVPIASMGDNRPSSKLELIKKLESGVSVARVCDEYGVKKQTVRHTQGQG